MLELYVLDESRVIRLRPGDGLNTRDLQLEFTSNDQVLINDWSLMLKENLPLIHEGRIFFLSRTEGSSIFLLEDGFCFGRSRSTPSWMSSKHFQITKGDKGWEIEDLNSRYGLYLNGKRIQQALLKTGDWIFAGGLSLIYFGSFLLSYGICSLKPVVIKEEILLDLECSRQPDPVEMEIQLPALEENMMSAGWFQSMGSSLMILISTLASFGISLMSHQSLSAMLPSLIQSSLMAAGFGAYGLINQRLNLKRHHGKNLEKKRAYKNYLSGIQDECLKMIARQNERSDNLLKMAAFNPEFMVRQNVFPGIPAVLKEEQLIRFKTGQISYERKNESMIQALESVMNSPCRARRLISFSKDGWSLIEGFKQEMLIPLLARILLFKRPETRVALVLSFSVDVSWHSQLQYGNRSLVFDSLPAAHSFMASHKNIPWIVITDQDSDESFHDEQIHYQARILLKGRKEEAYECFQASDLYLMPSLGMNFLMATHEFRQRKAAGCFDERLLNSRLDLKSLRKDRAYLKISLAENIVWDLEKEGPHVLIAGTTGSGKSEGLIMILLQLVLYNDPEHVQLFLIDFKGNATSSVFAQVPHIAGMISNLDENAIERTKKALDLELKKRQRLIDQWHLTSPGLPADIAGYNQMNPDKPLSRLFLVIDEFAQLKCSHPDFMDYIQQTARIGRSLGIHLILTTQKPSGIVDGQTMANTASKLCFKTRERQDSIEILGHDGAFRLEKSGEFILQTPLQESAGRAWYPRSRLFPETGVISLEDYQGPTVLERIIGLCKGEVYRWILHPDFDQHELKWGVYEDGLTRIKKMSLSRVKASMVFVADQYKTDTARAILSSSFIPGLTVETAGFKEGCSFRQLYAFFKIDSPVLLVIDVDRVPDWYPLEKLLENPRIHPVFLCSRENHLSRRLIKRCDLVMASQEGCDGGLMIFEKPVQLRPWPEFIARTSKGAFKRVRISVLQSSPEFPWFKKGSEILANPVRQHMKADISQGIPAGFAIPDGNPFLAESAARIRLVCSDFKGIKKAEQYIQFESWIHEQTGLSFDASVVQADVFKQAFEEFKENEDQILIFMDQTASELLYQQGYAPLRFDDSQILFMSREEMAVLEAIDFSKF